jgi:uncharacterized membrane protein YfcA
MFDISVYLLVLACIAMLCASMVQTAMGFGFALIVSPILLLIDPAMVPAPILISIVLQACGSSWVHREDIKWAKVNRAVIGSVPGTAAALVLILNFGQDGLSIFIATVVLLTVVMSLFKLKPKPSKKNHLVAGMFAGVSGTTSGISGPALALLYQHQKGEVVRANLSVFLMFGSIISLLGMSAVGLVNTTSWLYAGLFLPATVMGFWLGLRAKRFLKPDFMRPAILTLCSTSAMAVICTTLATHF